MEVYVLDSLLRRSDIIDKFVSFIWAERYSTFGDFEFVVLSTVKTRSLLTVRRRLVINNSYYVMTIETVENTVDGDGRALLSIKGRSIEALLEDRVAKSSMGNLTVDPKWVITGTPGYIARYVFQRICVDGALSIYDKIPFYTAGTIFPPDNIAESSEVITVELDPTTVYDALQTVCTPYDLGFRLVRNGDTSQLYFNVYSGSDRTASQSILPAVIFSPELDTLSNISEFTSVAEYKNVAYVFSPVGMEIVYAPGVDPSATGFERRVLVVKADDVTVTTGASLAMISKGREALANARAVSTLDGEINQSSPYTYMLDYNLGDLVEMRKADGVTNHMRVTEQIFVADSNGERSYPTLVVDLFITPGTWFAWDYNEVWDDLPTTGTTGFWEDA